MIQTQESAVPSRLIYPFPRLDDPSSQLQANLRELMADLAQHIAATNHTLIINVETQKDS
jgi:ABC-type thiamine transport system ATPase subunit